MAVQDLDYLEAEVTSNLISGGGTVGDVALAMGVAPAGGAIAHIHELMLDSLSTDFDFSIFETAAREVLDRILNIENVNLHTVQLVGDEDGVQYRDRDASEFTDTPFSTCASPTIRSALRR